MPFKKLLVRLVPALVAAIVIATPTAARAETRTVPLNPVDLFTYADAFDAQSCEHVAGGPFADRDAWVFELSRSAGADARFQSLRAYYLDLGWFVPFPRSVEATVIADGELAVATTGPGWKLVAGSAMVEDASRLATFKLLHTCPAGEPSEPPVDPTDPPEETTEPPAETTGPPTEPTESPEETTDPPTETASPPVEETTEPPVETTEPPEEATSEPPATTAPPEETTDPAEATTDPAEATTEPAEATTDPGEATTEPDEVTTDPDESTTDPTDPASSDPAEASSSPAEDAAAPDEASTTPAGHADVLPVTGLTLTYFTLAAAVLIVGGFGALLLARRRNAA